MLIASDLSHHHLKLLSHCSFTASVSVLLCYYWLLVSSLPGWFRLCVLPGKAFFCGRIRGFTKFWALTSSCCHILITLYNNLLLCYGTIGLCLTETHYTGLWCAENGLVSVELLELFTATRFLCSVTSASVQLWNHTLCSGLFDFFFSPCHLNTAIYQLQNLHQMLYHFSAVNRSEP